MTAIAIFYRTPPALGHRPPFDGHQAQGAREGLCAGPPEPVFWLRSGLSGGQPSRKPPSPAAFKCSTASRNATASCVKSEPAVGQGAVGSCVELNALRCSGVRPTSRDAPTRLWPSSTCATLVVVPVQIGACPSAARKRFLMYTPSRGGNTRGRFLASILTVASLTPSRLERRSRRSSTPAMSLISLVHANPQLSATLLRLIPRPAWLTCMPVSP